MSLILLAIFNLSKKLTVFFEVNIPYFSIITPVFNGSSFVETYINALLKQSFADWEVIIVDDCSTDDTVERLLLHIGSDTRFRVLRLASTPKAIPGPYYARNIGLSNSRGQFVCFYDIDDYWFPDFLSSHYTVHKSNSRIHLSLSSYFVGSSDLSYGYLKPRFDVIPVPLQRFLWNPIPNLTSCIRRDLALKQSFKPIHHEDYCLLV